MGSSHKEDAIDSKSINNMVDETTEMSERSGAVFGPIQHPIEPAQDDKPVECPLPNSTVLNDRRVPETFQRKMIEPMRKRHHSLGHEDHCRLSLSPQLTTLQSLQHLTSNNNTGDHI